MADNPFAKFATPSDAGQNPFAKFAPQPKPDAAAPPVAQFPNDQPGVTYGNVLPFAKDEKTGELSLAVPEMIRAPLRGAIEWGKGLTGQRDIREPESPDMVSAVMSIGGLRGAPGAAKAAPVSPAATPAQTAMKAGYVLTPAMATEKPSTISQLLSGWSGKIKLQQSASAKNQAVTNGLAAKSLGLPEDAVLNEATFTKIRQEAGKAYKAVADFVPETKADEAFKTQMGQLGSRASQAAQVFPDLMANPGIEVLSKSLTEKGAFPTQAGLDLVRELRFNANANLKAIGDPQKHSLGLAQREAATAIDDLIERNVESAAAVSPDVPGPLVQKYREARQLIARSHDVEGATNPGTGDVSAYGLAKLANKGRPLGGDLRTIADAANAFPKALQNPASFGGAENHSALDFFGSALSIAHGNPSVAGAILGRPIARSVLLSRPYQKGLAAGPPTSPSTSPSLAQAAVPLAAQAYPPAPSIDDILRQQRTNQ